MTIIVSAGLNLNIPFQTFPSLASTLLPFIHYQRLIMASLQSTASFSSLPPELRVKVFRYLMPTGTSIKPKLRVKRRREVNFPGRFLRVSKLFNAEAGAIFYSSNCFKSRDLFDGVVFLRMIGKLNDFHVTELDLGTFWFTYREAATLGFKYENAQEKVTDMIAKACPNLTYLAVGDFRPMQSGKWITKTLEKIRYLIRKFPKLSNVYYSVGCYKLVLSAETMEEAVKVSCLNLRAICLAVLLTQTESPRIQGFRHR